MTYQEALDWIHGRLAFGSRPGLQRVEALLEKLDNPQHKIKTVHIAGTNGKGSTVTDLRCLLEEENLKVGTYTSPFITYFNERIAINNRPIPNDDLVRWVLLLQPLVVELDAIEEVSGITEFEIVTALMFGYFAEQKVDIAIVEVGLGGLLDCTNVITPLAAAITTIGMDHMDILGNTIEEIAFQKAGIIKNEVPVILGELPESAVTVITAEADAKKSPIYKYGEAFSSSKHESIALVGERFTYQSEQLDLADIKVSLIGKHQVDNASVAIKLYEILAPLLGYTVSEKTIKSGLSQAHWSGRLEVVRKEPLILLDGAHNEPAVRRLVESLATIASGKKIHVMFASLSTKACQPMIELFQSLPNVELTVTTFDYPKARSIEEYPTSVLRDVKSESNWQDGLLNLTESCQKDDMIVVTGSLYFISQVRAFILGGKFYE
ncbi:bifunctional folylpolyglutamate synthase/dihydrofolate synthase [Vagococcus sp. PNs007]|uniref:tetrahydrofolate synthase n=1 Tax=Vagococcus proximus TaxID=2991417 RepID=A0ABT5X0F8_9ENTE|nr:folylpolyglutamate synthase/dihydrofolate synthase family protein [Vagococcus proximus]MDF0479491.1 bifunctional folylpolyglutamate synthase/dihydrofolate synthase [Vagococcus proximus]